MLTVLDEERKGVEMLEGEKSRKLRCSREFKLARITAGKEIKIVKWQKEETELEMQEAEIWKRNDK